MSETEVWTVIKYKPKEGCEEDFIKELKKAGGTNLRSVSVIDVYQGKGIDELNENLKKFLKDEGFNIDFDKCIKNKEIEDFVLNDRIEGTKNFKVNATPTIIINNEKFEKSLNYKNLKKIIEKMI